MSFRRRLSQVLLGLVSFWAVTSRADYFTEPPSFELDRTGTRVTVSDLNSRYALGQKVQVTWEVPSVPWISLVLVHWGKNAGVPVASFITNDRNNGYYTWYIGDGDGITKEILAENPNFALKIIDPTGNYTKTGEPEGFINNELQSRGFSIRANETTAVTEPTSSATSSATPSATGSASSGGSVSLSGGAVAGIAVACVAAGALIMLGIWFIWLRKRRSGNNEVDPPGHHPTPTLHPVMHHDMRQDSAYASPNSSGDRMFDTLNTHGAHLSHQTSNVSPASPMRRHTPPPSYPSPVDHYGPPMTELSGVREPQEVPSMNASHPPELAGSHQH